MPAIPHAGLRSERGQVLPLVVLALALAGVGIHLIVELGVIANERAQARTAADAAALAGAAEGPTAARTVAESNGAVLERYDAAGLEVEVVVRVGRARARARAAREVVSCNLLRDPCPP